MSVLSNTKKSILFGKTIRTPFQRFCDAKNQPILLKTLTSIFGKFNAENKLYIFSAADGTEQYVYDRTKAISDPGNVTQADADQFSMLFEEWIQTADASFIYAVGGYVLAALVVPQLPDPVPQLPDPPAAVQPLLQVPPNLGDILGKLTQEISSLKVASEQQKLEALERERQRDQERNVREQVLSRAIQEGREIQSHEREEARRAVVELTQKLEQARISRDPVQVKPEVRSEVQQAIEAVQERVQEAVPSAPAAQGQRRRRLLPRRAFDLTGEQEEDDNTHKKRGREESSDGSHTLKRVVYKGIMALNTLFRGEESTDKLRREAAERVKP